VTYLAISLTVSRSVPVSATRGFCGINEQPGDMMFVTASAWASMASGSSTVAILALLIPVVVVLLISAVPIYFRMSERRRRHQGEQQMQKQRGQRDLAAEVEELRREQAED
jgi:hypothetical protein